MKRCSLTTADTSSSDLDGLENQFCWRRCSIGLRKYRDSVPPLLLDAAMAGVDKIAVAVGASVAISPWKLLDAFIAINASLESAAHVLRVSGIRPNANTVASCAFDALVATFLSATMENFAGDVVSELTEQVSSVVGQSIMGQVAPNVAQGVAVGYFVRRLGRRMVVRFAGK